MFDRIAAYLIVGALTGLGISAAVSSPNELGYRLKGALMVAAGPCFYALGLARLWRTPAPAPAAPASDGTLTSAARMAQRQARRVLIEALIYVSVIELAAIMTLTLDWTVYSNRWRGVGSQLLAGIVGIVGCARFISWERALGSNHDV